MKTITISLTAEQYAGLTKAQLAYDMSLENTPDESKQVGTPEAYAQFAWAAACDSYTRQWSDATIEGLQGQLALTNDAQARAKSRADELEAQLTMQKAKVAELEEVAKSAVEGAQSVPLYQRLDAL